MSARSKAKQMVDARRAKVKGGAAKAAGRRPASGSKTKKLSARARYAAQRSAAALKHGARVAKEMAQEALNAPSGFEAKATGRKRGATEAAPAGRTAGRIRRSLRSTATRKRAAGTAKHKTQKAGASRTGNELTKGGGKVGKASPRAARKRAGK
jgi:hypothetical protein